MFESRQEVNLSNDYLNKFITTIRLWSEIVSKKLVCEERQSLKFGFDYLPSVCVISLIRFLQ